MYRCTYKYLDLVINIRFNLSKDTIKKKRKRNIDRYQFPGHLIKWHPCFVTFIVLNKECVY